VYFVILFNLCLSFYNYLILFLGFRFWSRLQGPGEGSPDWGCCLGRRCLRSPCLVTSAILTLFSKSCEVTQRCSWSRDVTSMSSFDVRNSIVFCAPLFEDASFRSWARWREKQKQKNVLFLLLLLTIAHPLEMTRWKSAWDRERETECTLFLLSFFCFCLFVFSLSAKINRLPMDDSSPFFNRKGWNMIWALALVAKGQIAVQN
jgi:hypothetical protein